MGVLGLNINLKRAVGKTKQRSQMALFLKTPDGRLEYKEIPVQIKNAPCMRKFVRHG